MGRRSDGFSITTLNVPGSVLREVCSSAVEKDRDRMWAIGFDGVHVSSSVITFRVSGEGGSGVREPEKLSLQPLFVGRRAFSSTIALSGGVAGGKTKVSGDRRVRWLPERTTGLNDDGVVS